MATATDRNETVFAMMVREYKKAEEAGKERPTATELRQKAEKIDPAIKEMEPRSFTGTYILSASRAAKKGTEGTSAPKTRKARKTSPAAAVSAPSSNGNGHSDNSLVNVLSEFAEQMYQTFGGTDRIAFYQFLGTNLESVAEAARKVVETPETANA